MSKVGGGMGSASEQTVAESVPLIPEAKEVVRDRGE